MNKEYRAFWLVLFILMVAIFFRFYKLDSIPPGLFRDEAMNGNNALEALTTHNFKIFYPENNGREGLFINLQAFSVNVFGNKPWALRIVSAIFGILTVWGLYFLAKTLFNPPIGLIASFLMAVSFWHVNFSRIGFRAIMAPLFLVWGLYFLWRGLASTRLSSFILSGVMLGLGFHSYIAFRAIPLAIIITLLAYWHFIYKDFKLANPDKYQFLRNHLLWGLLAVTITASLIFAPLAYHFYQVPQDFFGRTTQISIFSNNPVTMIKQLLINTGQTLAMFNFQGDWNWRHNLAGAPMLIWPVGIFFIVGFIRSFLKIWKIRKHHGHLPTTHTLLLATFFVGLLPVVLSNEGLPHALRSILIVPIVYIFTAEGMWWFFEKLKDWYSLHDTHLGETRVIVVFTALIYLLTIAVIEYDRYFNQWAGNPNVASGFNQENVNIGYTLNNMSPNIKKYVLVRENGGVLVNGTGIPAQTTMFITDTYTPQKQQAKNLYYLTKEQFERGEYDRNGIVIPLQ